MPTRLLAQPLQLRVTHESRTTTDSGFFAAILLPCRVFARETQILIPTISYAAYVF